MAYKIKVLISDMDRQTGEMLAAWLRERGMEVRVGSGEMTLQAAELGADAVITGRDPGDIRLPGVCIIVISEGKCTEAGKGVFVMKSPVDPGRICAVIERLCRGRRNVLSVRTDTAAVAGEMLRQSGIPGNLRGTHYLVRALVMAADGAQSGREIFAAVAAECGVSEGAVDRAVHQTICIACQRDGASFMKESFGEGVPSHSSFVNRMADSLRKRIGREAEGGQR